MLEANYLLQLGGYRPLNNSEIGQIDPTWIRGRPLQFEVPSKEVQLAALPVPVKLVGRDETLSELTSALAAEQSPPLFFITGMGGIGKSSVAAALARHHHSQPDYQSVMWIEFRADMLQSAEEILNELTIYIGEWLAISNLNRTSVKSRDTQIRIVLQKARHLIVIDGVDEQVHSQLLAENLPKLAGNSKFIITSRVAPQQVANTHIHRLEGLNEDEARRMLIEQSELTRGIAPDEITKSLTRNVYAAVGGHPLTLSYLPHLLINHEIDTLIDAIELGDLDIQSALFSSVWQSLSQPAKHSAFGLALLGSSGGHHQLLERLVDLPANEFRLAQDHLFQFGLMRAKGTVGRKIYALHPLIRQYIQQLIIKQSAEDDSGPSEFTQIAIRAFELWQTELRDNRGLLSLEKAADYRQGIAFTLTLPIDPHLTEARLAFLTQLFGPLRESGLLNLWEPIWAKIIAVDEAGSAAHKSVLFNQLGTICLRKHNVAEAIRHFSQALEIAEKNSNHPEVARAHHQLSWAYHHHDDPKQALHHNDLALETFSEHKLTLFEYGEALIRRGIYFANKEESVQAEKFFRLAISFFDETGQAEHLSQGYYNLALLYFRKKDFENSISTFSQVKRSLRNYPDAIRKIRTLLSESAAHFTKGDFELANETLESIDTDYLEQSHNYDLLSLTQNNLANVLLKSGRFSDAEKLLQKSLWYWMPLKSRINIALVFESFGDLHAEKGDWDEAEVWYIKALREIATLTQTALVKERRKQLESKLEPDD